MSGDLSKDDLYQAVKVLVDLEKVHPTICLDQHKLFSLFSIAFQYMLYRSSKITGTYIIRIEDASLADKLGRKAKDSSTRKFIRRLLVPRKLPYHKSIFYLDFFHMSSWSFTNDIPRNRLQGALIVKNTFEALMHETPYSNGESSDSPIEEDFYFTSLVKIAPKTLMISTTSPSENMHLVRFPFLKTKTKSLSGVTLSGDTDWDDD